MEFPDSKNSRFGLVPRYVIGALENMGVELNFIDPKANLPAMMWR